jgi:predicted transcriptional regulator
MTEPLLHKLLLQKEEKPITMLSLRIEPDLVRKLDAISARVSKSRSQVIKLILEEGVDKLDKTFTEIDHNEGNRQYERNVQKATM